MDVIRTADITKDNEGTNALPNETPEKAGERTPSLTFTSERFTFNTFAEENIDCIDKAGGLFAEFRKKPPTLKDALMSMDYGEKTEKLLGIFTDKATEKFEEMDAPGLNTEDVAAIFCYTYEWNKKKFGDGIDSPYRKLNKSISVERNNPALKKTRAFLFLLLQALRKLPRYTPANRTLYRGIDIHVQTDVDPERPETKPYAAGNEKTWWAFTSTTEDLEITRDFVQRNEGTLFTLSGEAWGYDISVFSNYPDEKEVLLEPERMLSIKGVKKEGAIIAVNAEILDTPLVLKDYIKVKPVKIKEKRSTIKEVPHNLRVESITESTVTLSWDAPEKNGGDVLSYQVSAKQTSDRFINRNPESTYIVKKEEKDIVRGSEEKKDETKYTVKDLEEGKEYEFRVRCKYNDGWGKEWSEKVVVRVAYGCVWKTCPGDVDDNRKYSADGRNPRGATKVNSDSYCTIIGNTHVPLSKVTSWHIKVLKSRDNDGGSIYIGIAPNDINQNDDENYKKCGWYFDCYYSTLYSGPPHNYLSKKYGPRKKDGQYVHTGDSVGVVVDTTKGDLSFVLNGVNRGAAYEGIPLDKPLVPCVLLWWQGDSVELDASEVKEKVKASIPVPSNITVKSTTWDTITFTWDKVSGASFYQTEVDGSILRGATTTNTFTKRRLLPETEHSFRVRTARGSSVSKWSGVAKGRTLKAPEFSECVWKECPDNIDKDKKYKLEGSFRVATNANDGDFSTIIGSVPIPLNTVTTWSIKILKSKNNGIDIWIGVAPFDINQNDVNFYNCGWYFDCYGPTLRSGPPHNYRGKEYGPRKEDGQYVHTGDSVGVVVDTTKGDLSFVLDGVNLGAAYEGIPLDKPLVPCVLLCNSGGSVELDTSEVKENEVDSSIPVPSNITAEGTTCDSITLTWGEVAGASFYQTEVDGSKSWGATTTNTFTKDGLFPETEHSFRVRTVKGSSVSKWSNVVDGRTLKAPDFSECVWKKCPDYVDEAREYSVDEGNLRVATKANGGVFSTIIGNIPIPLNKVTSWSVKTLKSKDDDGYNIYIGVASFDINQNNDNYNKCGWYFDCYYSTLDSGPPHNYSNKDYGPRKEKGQYVHTGDSVGVVVDTTRGDLSFVLNGVNCGVAYEEIPLDKPLVPCVLLWCQGDSVEIKLKPKQTE